MYYWQFIYIENVLKLYRKKVFLEKKLKAYVRGSISYVNKKDGRKELYWNTYEKGVLCKKYLSPKLHSEIIEQLDLKRKECPVIRKELTELNKLYKQLLPMAAKILKD